MVLLRDNGILWISLEWPLYVMASPDDDDWEEHFDDDPIEPSANVPGRKFCVNLYLRWRYDTLSQDLELAGAFYKYLAAWETFPVWLIPDKMLRDAERYIYDHPEEFDL